MDRDRGRSNRVRGPVFEEVGEVLLDLLVSLALWIEWAVGKYWLFLHYDLEWGIEQWKKRSLLSDL